jgi:hypothetical protein
VVKKRQINETESKEGLTFICVATKGGVSSREIKKIKRQEIKSKE